MAAMEGVVVGGGGGGGGGGLQEQSQSQPQQAAPKAVERLNPAVQQQLNLESVKTRAISLFKAISRILEDLDAIARINAVPKWLLFLTLLLLLFISIQQKNKLKNNYVSS